MYMMNVPDREFAKLLARWAFQSAYVTGRSGGRTHCDQYAPQMAKAKAELASFIPFPEQPWYGDFTKEWSKQDHFHYAKPLLSRLFTAMAAKHGKDWAVYANSAKNWYRIGLKMGEFLAPAVEKLVALKRPLVLYGRDCLPLYRALYGRVEHVVYIEGVSRAVIHEQTYLVGYLTDCIARVLGPAFTQGPGKSSLVHVDTGFAGSIPSACFRSLCGGSPGRDNIRMLTSESHNFVEWNLGLTRATTTRAEYVPKVFYRPHRWIGHAGRIRFPGEVAPRVPYVPELLVAGDAVNAASLIIGVMAHSAKLRYSASKEAR